MPPAHKVLMPKLQESLDRGARVASYWFPIDHLDDDRPKGNSQSLAARPASPPPTRRRCLSAHPPLAAALARCPHATRTLPPHLPAQRVAAVESAANAALRVACRRIADGRAHRPDRLDQGLHLYSVGRGRGPGCCPDRGRAGAACHSVEVAEKERRSCQSVVIQSARRRHTHLVSGRRRRRRRRRHNSQEMAVDCECQ